MRHASVALGLMCLFVAKLAGQGTAKPGPEHRKLEVFAGNWTYVIEQKASPFGPAGRVTGTDRNALLGGFFLVRQYKQRGAGGDLSGIEILGYDPAKKTYTDSGFESSGLAYYATWTVNGDTWSIVGGGMAGGKEFRQRCALTFGAGSTTAFTVKCDASPDGSAWTPAFEGNWKKLGRTS